MPLAAFLQTSKIRSELGQAISSYGISFLKTELFQAGANPVIYGLSNRKAKARLGLKGERFFNPNDIPLPEQYRFVSYNPTGVRKIDWTHEREWRWPYRGDMTGFEKELEEFGVVSEIKSFPSLPINEVPISDVGLIVKTKDEAMLLLYDVLALYDRTGNINYKFIFYTEQIESIDEILSPSQEKAEIKKSTINLSKFTKPRPIKLTGFIEERYETN